MSDTHRPVVNASQIRAARALLGWSQEDLAQAANLSIATIRKIETGHISPRDKTMGSIISALEHARVEFAPPMGVRLRANDVTMLDGDDCYSQLLDDVYHTMKGKNEEALFIYADPSLASKDEVESLIRTRKNGVKWRFLSQEGNTFMRYPIDEYRWIPKKFFKRNVQLVYGTKVAMGFDMDTSRNRTTKIIVIDSQPLADSVKNLFEFLWKNCRKPTFSTAPECVE